MAFVININYLGIKEQFSISDKDLLKYINSLDFKSRLEYAIGIDIESHDVKDQLTMLASYTDKLIAKKLNPAQINAMRAFLRKKLDELP